MSGPLYKPGDFVWSRFPERENPARPGPAEHVSLTLAASGMTSAKGETVISLLLAYTTSQPWTGPLPPGVFRVDRAGAATMGQDRPFVIDARRLAAVPLTRLWFPRVGQPGHGILGLAPKSLRHQVEDAANRLLERHREVVEFLGPLQSGQKRT